MTYATDPNSNFAKMEQAQADLRDGFENSRELVRQSHMLIELSEAAPADSEELAAA